MVITMMQCCQPSEEETTVTPSNPITLVTPIIPVTRSPYHHMHPRHHQHPQHLSHPNYTLLHHPC